MSKSGFIYFDHNATTPPNPEVVEVVTRLMEECWANPGSRHSEGRYARRVLEDSRELIASILGAHPEEVLFTSGGTESNNLALRGLIQPQPGIILSGSGEHPATAETIKSLLQSGYRLRELAVNDAGILAENFDRIDWTDVRLVTLLLAHNETGVIQESQLLSNLCQESNVPLHLDGVQAVGKIPVNFAELGVASLSFGAHKFHGPRGIGGLLLRRGARLTPLLTGGFQEEGRRPGTEAVPLIAGMAKALELWFQNQEHRTSQLIRLRTRLEQGLKDRLESIVVLAESSPRLPNTSTIAFPGLDGEALLVGLDLAGVACSLGSTCASGSSEPAPILIAMGVSPELQKSAVRFSLGFSQSEAEIDEGISRIVSVVNRLQAVRLS